jgi:hypothetical protein
VLKSATSPSRKTLVAIQRHRPKMTNHTDQNWKQFICTTLTKNHQFGLDKSFRKGDTDIEIYKQLIGDTETTLQVGYLSGDRLIYLHTYNTKTPGLNKNQIEYFNEHDFNSNESYGRPGLEFTKQNQEGVLNELQRGLDGQEVIFYKNGILSHSKLTIISDNETSNSFSHTYHFDKVSIWTRLKNKFSKQINHCETKEVELKQIFGGLK